MSRRCCKTGLAVIYNFEHSFELSSPTFAAKAQAYQSGVPVSRLLTLLVNIKTVQLTAQNCEWKTKKFYNTGPGVDRLFTQRQQI
jgi:hypothetical protein